MCTQDTVYLLLPVQLRVSACWCFTTIVVSSKATGPEQGCAVGGKGAAKHREALCPWVTWICLAADMGPRCLAQGGLQGVSYS